MEDWDVIKEQVMGDLGMISYFKGESGKRSVMRVDEEEGRLEGYRW